MVRALAFGRPSSPAKPDDARGPLARHARHLQPAWAATYIRDAPRFVEVLMLSFALPGWTHAWLLGGRSDDAASFRFHRIGLSPLFFVQLLLTCLVVAVSYFNSRLGTR